MIYSKLQDILDKGNYSRLYANPKVVVNFLQWYHKGHYVESNPVKTMTWFTEKQTSITLFPVLHGNSKWYKLRGYVEVFPGVWGKV